MESLWFLRRNNFPQETYTLYKHQMIIGRSDHSGIVLSHTTVSKRHCRLTVSDDGSTVYLEDLESGNGTYVNNNEKIASLKRIELNENDQIGIALPPDHICPNLTIKDHYSFKLLKRLGETQQCTEFNTTDTITIKQEIILDLEDEMENKEEVENYEEQNIAPNNIDEDEIDDEQEAENRDEQNSSPYNIDDEMEDEQEDENREEQNISPDIFCIDADEMEVEEEDKNIPPDNIDGNNILKLCDLIDNNVHKIVPKAMVYIPDVIPMTSTRGRASKKNDRSNVMSLKQTKTKRGRKSSKSSTPIKRVITMSQKQIRLSKLKEIAEKQNEEKAKALKDLELEPKKDKTVVAKITAKNRGSFLLNDPKEPPKAKIVKKQNINNSRRFDSHVSLEENLTWSKFLHWIACWSAEEFKSCKENTFLRLKNNLKMMEVFKDYDSYKKVLTNFLLIEIWNNVSSSYEKNKKIPEYKFKTMHSIEEHSSDMCIKICIGPMSIKSLVYPKYGELLIIKFNVEGIDYTHFAIVKNIISNFNDKGIKILELAIFWRNRYLKVMFHTEVNLKIICNISHELSMLSALFQLNNTLVRDIIVSPKISDFSNTLYDYPKNLRIHSMDNYQLSALRKCFAAKRLIEPTVQLIDGLPGTGKTMLICWMALEYLAKFSESKYEKILICAQSNTGVDMLLKQLLKLEEQHYKHLNLKIVRPGREIAMQPWAQKFSIQNLAIKQPTSSIYNTSENIEKDILLGANIIVTTLHWTTKLSTIKNLVTWCMIDDASSANEPEILCPISLNVKHLVLCGNIRKSPNAALSKVSLEYKFLRSTFTRMLSELKPWGNDLVNSLETQHRMHPEIMKWPNKILYFDTLKCSEHSTKTIMPHYRLFVIPGSKNINHDTFESILIARITWAIYELVKSGKSNVSLVVLAQNLDQCSIIKKYMNNDNGREMISIMTFDQFEGNENDIVIVAPLKNPSNKEMEACFIHAKQTLIIFFRSSQKLNTRLHELLEDAQERNITVDIPPAFGTLIGCRDIKSDAELLKKMLKIN